jgi:hypothetical protein
MKKLFLRCLWAWALAVPLLLPAASQACGPDCDSGGGVEEDVDACFAGRIGSLAQQGPQCRAIGFLLIRGVSPADQQLMVDSLQPENPPLPDVEVWKAARAKVLAAPSAPVPATEALLGDFYFPNCLSSGFQLAAKTLEERVAKWGASSPEVGAWLKAQDAVFSNCGGNGRVLPEPAAESAPPLARADRAYQTAAALFYSRGYDEAVQAFDRIGADASSPWRAWARLGAVRALIRKATVNDNSVEQQRPLLEQARERCVAIVKDAGLKDIHRQTRQLTWLIDSRLRADKQLGLLGRVLLEKPDANFGYAFRDYFTLRQWKLPPATDELSEFLAVFEKEDSYAQALGWWKKTHSVPWLVAALSRAHGKEPELAELLAQSETVPRASPAYVSVHAERGRLALEAGRWEPARQELLPLLEMAADALPSPTAQRLTDELREAAQSFEEWAKYAGLSSKGSGSFLSQGVPLARFKDEKVLALLEPKLRKEVVLAGWTRAVLLDQWEEERALEPAVEKAAPELAEDLKRVKERKTPDERKVAALLLLLKSPGMSPWVRPYRSQVLRSYDICSENGWCAVEAKDFYLGCDAAKAACGTRFISAQERRQVLSELQALAKLGKAPELLIRLTLELAKAHPEDALVPETLHEAVVATHYSRNFCGQDEPEGKARSELSKQAFQVLQRKYAKTRWAKETPYHY